MVGQRLTEHTDGKVGARRVVGLCLMCGMDEHGRCCVLALGALPATHRVISKLPGWVGGRFVGEGDGDHSGEHGTKPERGPVHCGIDCTRNRCGIPVGGECTVVLWLFPRGYFLLVLGDGGRAGGRAEIDLAMYRIQRGLSCVTTSLN